MSKIPSSTPSSSSRCGTIHGDTKHANSALLQRAIAETSITIINKLGLHARAAAKLVEQASQFEAHSRLLCESQEADCKSIISLLMLAAGQGTTLKLSAQGRDAQAACNAIVQLIESRFGEDE